MKKLYRTEDNKVISGVCGGFGEYFNIDPNLIRIGVVLLSCCCGAGVIAYIVAACILPTKSNTF